MPFPRLQQQLPRQRSGPPPRLAQRRHHRGIEPGSALPETPQAPAHQSLETHIGNQNRTTRLDFTLREALQKRTSGLGTTPLAGRTDPGTEAPQRRNRWVYRLRLHRTVPGRRGLGTVPARPTRLIGHGWRNIQPGPERANSRAPACQTQLPVLLGWNIQPGPVRAHSRDPACLCPTASPARLGAMTAPCRWLLPMLGWWDG